MKKFILTNTPEYEKRKIKAEKEMKMKIAKKMVKQNLPIDTIVSVTELKKDMVEKLLVGSKK